MTGDYIVLSILIICITFLWSFSNWCAYRYGSYDKDEEKNGENK